MLMFAILEDRRRNDGYRKGDDGRKFEEIVLVEIVSRSGLRRKLERVTDGRHETKVFFASDNLPVNIAPL